MASDCIVCKNEITSSENEVWIYGGESFLFAFVCDSCRERLREGEWRLVKVS